ncbi:hypothetical protein [Bacillus pseudomycoides]|uniref:hypothetical protein n=1 Tax=Bacillus pseudomycoides TaxID=64104 RepID=UPI00159BDE73|nr:hypothetical protein [Bacillus pseudomycoides]
MTNLAKFVSLLSTLVLVIFGLFAVNNPKKLPIVTYVGTVVILFGILAYFLAYEN